MSELGQSLRLARQFAGLSVDDVAARTGLADDDLAALESGEPERMADRIATLRSLRVYGAFLGFSGDALVLAAVDLWPVSIGGHHDITGSHILSVSGSGGPQDGDTGVPPSTITTGHLTGVIDSVQSPGGGPFTRPVSLYDTGRVVFDDTGEVGIVKAPVALRRAVVTLAVLVALGAVALGAVAVQSHAAGWYRHVKSAIGITPSPPTTSRPSNAHDAVESHPLPSVTMAYLPSPSDPSSVSVRVGAPSFTVKFVAFGSPCWIKVTEAGTVEPVVDQVLAAGTVRELTITRPTTLVMAARSGRAYLYEGSRFIGWYFPGKAPFTMNFTATGS